MINSILSLFRRTYNDWLEDDGLTNSAALSFHAIMGIPSLILFTLFIGSIFLKKQILQAAIITDVSMFADDMIIQALNLLFKQLSVDSTFNLGIFISFFIYLWSAGNIFLQLQRLINKMWGLKDTGRWLDKFIYKRVSALLAAIVFGILVVLSTVFEMIFFLISDDLKSVFSIPVFFISFVSSGMNFLSLILLFMYLYRVLPSAKPRWKYVFTGSFLTVIMLTIGKYLMGIYLSYSNMTTLYGTIGSIIAIFLWVYMSSVIVTFMVEFTGVYSKID